MRIKWLRQALLDLDEVESYIARNNPAAAAEVVTKAVKAKDSYDFYYYGNLPFRGGSERAREEPSSSRPPRPTSRNSR